MALALDERTSDLDQQALSIERFFDQCLGNRVDVSQLEEMFHANSPLFFEELLTKPITYKKDEQ